MQVSSCIQATHLSCLLNFSPVNRGQQGGPEVLAGAADGAWALALGALVLGVRHVGLGGWAPEECIAIENELGAWQQTGSLSEREPALR